MVTAESDLPLGLLEGLVVVDGLCGLSLANPSNAALKDTGLASRGRHRSYPGKSSGTGNDCLNYYLANS